MIPVAAALGTPLARALPRRVYAGRRPPRVIHPGCPHTAVSRMIGLASTAPASGTWGAATTVPIGFEFWLDNPETVYQLGWMNGTGTMADSMDVAVYDSSGNRKISTTSTARATASALQLVDVADTVLVAGRYRLVGSSTGVAANNAEVYTGPGAAAGWSMGGLLEAASGNGTLPDPLTLAAASTAVSCPIIVALLRAVG